MSSVLYPCDLTDREWTLLEPLLPCAKPGGRPRGVNLRRMLNGIFSLLRSGCAWRLLPRDYGPWSTVYHFFRTWRLDGTWERIHMVLRERVRRQAGREPTPSAAISDSQSVKTTEQGGPRGYDGGKKVNGRKWHLLVDTLGLLLKVVVHPANVQDRDGAKLVLADLPLPFPRLQHLWADQGYTGGLLEWIERELGWSVEIVEHVELAWVDQGSTGEEVALTAAAHGSQLEVVQLPAAKRGFVLLPRRWVVEGTQSQCLQLALDVQERAAHDRAHRAAEPACRGHAAARSGSAGVYVCSTGSGCTMSRVSSASAPLASAPPRPRALPPAHERAPGAPAQSLGAAATSQSAPAVAAAGSPRRTAVKVHRYIAASQQRRRGGPA